MLQRSPSYLNLLDIKKIEVDTKLGKKEHKLK